MRRWNLETLLYRVGDALLVADGDKGVWGAIDLYKRNLLEVHVEAVWDEDEELLQQHADATHQLARVQGRHLAAQQLVGRTSAWPGFRSTQAAMVSMYQHSGDLDLDDLVRTLFAEQNGRPPAAVALVVGAALALALTDANALLGPLTSRLLLSPRHIGIDWGGYVRLRPALPVELNRSSATGVGLIADFSSMSPERVRGEALGPHHDSWGVGVVLYRLLCGRHPFERATAMEQLQAIVTSSFAPIDAQRADVSANVAELVGRCLARSPSDRPHIPDLATALEAALRVEGFGAGDLGTMLQHLLPQQHQQTQAFLEELPLVTLNDGAPRVVLTPLPAPTP